MPAVSPNEPPTPTSYQHLQGRQLMIAMSGLLLGLLLSALDSTIVGTAMPRIVADLGGLEHYAWVATAYLLTSTAAVPIFGKLSDIYGRKWFYIGGMVGFMAASALCGLSQSMTQLIAFRGLQGVFGGILMANAFAIIADLFPPAERGKWQGVTSSTFGIASVVGPWLGGWLTDGPGWRWVFYVNIPVGILAVAVLTLGLPYIRAHGHHTIDWAGAALVVLSTVPLLLALSLAGPDHAWGSPLIVGLLLLAAAMTALFVWVESRVPEPILDPRYFRDRTFVISTTAMFLVGAGMFGAIMYVPLFMQGVVGASAAASGAVLTPMMLAMVVTSTLGGQAISRTGRYKWASVGGLAIMSLGLFLQQRLGLGTTNAEAVRAMLVIGLGLGLAMPTFTLAVQNAFPIEQVGAVTSAVQFFRSVGSTIGVAVMGTMLTNRLTSQLAANLPKAVSDAIGDRAIKNPQALASPQAAAALQEQLAKLPGGDQLFAELMLTMRQALAVAMHQVFLMAAIVGVAATVIAFGLHEAPLRKRQRMPMPAVAD